MKFLYVFLIAPTVFCAPTVDVEEEVMEKKVHSALTVEQFDSYINILQMFKDMLPKDLMNTINNLNVTEKGEIVNFITNWFQNKIQRPENKGEIVYMIKEYLPTVYDKIDQLNTTFYTKFNALKPETQALLRKWRDRAVAIEGKTPAESASRQLQLVTDFANELQRLDAETKEDLRSQFPTAIKLTEGLGFTVLTTIAMIAQKLSESLSPAVAVTQGPVECSIPLDR